MEDSSKQRPNHLQPPSPIDEELPPTPSPRTNTGPVSPWIRKPDPERLSQLQAESQVHMPDPDLEAGGAAGQKAKKRMICGCSKPTFIIVLFFLIVIVAAAIGGGVGGTMFSNKRFVVVVVLVLVVVVPFLSSHAVWV